MSVIQMLLLTWAAGLVLERRGDKLILKGVTRVTPAKLLDLLRDHKAELLAIMTDTAVKS